jgi:hypothetical protein
MSRFTPRANKQHWFRFAIKLGLLATDAALWSSLARMLSDRESARDAARLRERSSYDLQARQPGRGWSRASTLLAGVGIGVGLGILCAPMSGEQARLALRETASNFKNKMDDVADWAGRRNSSIGRRSTGTYAD